MLHSSHLRLLILKLTVGILLSRISPCSAQECLYVDGSSVEGSSFIQKVHRTRQAPLNESEDGRAKGALQAFIQEQAAAVWSRYATANVERVIKRHLHESCVVILVFAFVWIGMVRLEAAGSIGGPSRSGCARRAGAWRLVQEGTDVFEASAENEALQKTMASLRKLRVAAIATGLMMVLTLVAGHRIGSLSLLGDGVHLLGDTLGYFGLYMSIIASQWGSHGSFTYGFGRVELLSALAAFSVQYHEAIELGYDAWGRFWNPKPLQPNAGTIISVLGCLSMSVNICLIYWMASSGTGCGHNHGSGGTAVSMAIVHIVCDVGQNAIVIITGVVLRIWPHFYAIDPLCLLCFLTLLLLSTCPRIWEIVCVLLEAAPGGVDCAQMRQDLLGIKDVTRVQDFHVWCITPGKTAVTARLYTKGSPEDTLVGAETILTHRYAIRHCTLRVCDDEDDDDDNDPHDADCVW